MQKICMLRLAEAKSNHSRIIQQPHVLPSKLKVSTSGYERNKDFTRSSAHALSRVDNRMNFMKFRVMLGFTYSIHGQLRNLKTLWRSSEKIIFHICASVGHNYSTKLGLDLLGPHVLSKFQVSASNFVEVIRVISVTILVLYMRKQMLATDFPKFTQIFLVSYVN